MAKFCKYCGSAIKEGAKFCEECGKAAGTGSAPGQVTAAPATAAQDTQAAQPTQPVQQAPAQQRQQHQTAPGPAFHAYPPQQTQPTQQAPAQQYQQPPSYPPAPPQPYAPVQPVKKSNGLLIYRIAAAVIIVVLIAAGVYGLLRKPGGSGGGDNGTAAVTPGGPGDGSSGIGGIDVGDIERGDSAPVRDGVIELGGAVLDFLGSGETSGVSMTALRPTEQQRPDGMISELFEVTLEDDFNGPVALSIPIDERDIPDADDVEVTLAVGSRFAGDSGDYTTYIYLPATIADGAAGATFVPANFLQGLVADGAAGGRTTPFTNVFTCYIAVKRVHYFVIDETEPGRYIDGPIAIYSPYEVGRVGLDEMDFRDACQSDLSMMTEVYLYFQEYASESYNARTVWPLQVYYDPGFRGARYELSTIRYEGGDSGQLFWNGNPADGIIRMGRDCWDGSGRYNLRARFAHEFCHFLMAGFVRNYNAPRWAKEAFAGFGAMAIGGVWDAEVMSNYLLLFDGLLPKTNSDNEGYARALLLWYIADLQEAAETPMALTAMRNFAPIVTQLDLERANQALDEILSVNKELYVYRFFRSLVGWPDDLFGIGHGGPSYFYSEALYGNLGQTLYCDLPDPDDEDPLKVGQVTLPVNYCGAQFAAVSFSDELIDELREVSEAVFEMTSPGNCFMDVYEIDPNGNATPSVSGTRFVTSGFMEKISEGYTYLVMVVGLGGSSSAPANYTISVRFVGDEDVVGTYYGPYVRDVNIDRLHTSPMSYMTMVVERVGGDGSDTYNIRMFGEMMQEIRMTVTYDPETKMYTGRFQVNYDQDPYYYYFNIEFSVENGTMTGRWFHTVIEVIQPRCFELERID